MITLHADSDSARKKQQIQFKSIMRIKHILAIVYDEKVDSCLQMLCNSDFWKLARVAIYRNGVEAFSPMVNKNDMFIELNSGKFEKQSKWIRIRTISHERVWGNEKLLRFTPMPFFDNIYAAQH